jgi:hypothetical protein
MFPDITDGKIDVALMPPATFLDSRCGHRLISAPVDAGIPLLESSSDEGGNRCCERNPVK